MKVKVPKTIKVGGWAYSIMLMPSLTDEGLVGAHNNRQTRIEINPERPKSRWSQTLLHEFLHAINYVYLNNKLAEDEIGGLSEGLYQIFTELDIDFDWSLIDE